ncbi:MAG: ABC transporter ATP-binding protein [Sulfobacillus sp.]
MTMPQSAAQTGLSVDALTKRFSRVIAVENLSFSLQAGEVVGLLGPNGAGKTTTLLCLAGLLRPDSGVISFGGQPLGPERGRTVTLIAETPEVYPMLTVWEHLVFVARSCGLGPDWVERGGDLLGRLGLAEHRHALGESLSKGMRQKTLIAAAVLAQTPVLLLDEPMIGLDPKGQRELRQILTDLRQVGVAVVVSTHLLESAEAISDRVLILKQGHLLAEGPVSELRSGAADHSSLEDIFLELTE